MSAGCSEVDQGRSKPNEVAMIGLAGIFRAFYRQIGWRFAAVGVLALVTACVEGIGFTAFLPLFSLFEQGQSTQIAPANTLTKDWLRWMPSSAGACAALIVALFFVKALLSFVNSIWQTSLGAQIVAGKRFEYYTALKGADFLAFESRGGGSVANVLATQAGLLAACFKALLSIATAFARAAIFAGAAAIIAWEFSLIAVVAGGAVWLLLRRINLLGRKFAHVASAKIEELNRKALQLAEAFKYLAATGSLDLFDARVKRSIEGVAHARIIQGRIAALSTAVVEPIVVATVIVVMVLSVSQGGATFAEIAVALLLLHRSLAATMSIQTSWQQVMATAGAVDIVESAINELDHLKEHSGCVSAPADWDEIQFKDVSLRYPNAATLSLDNVNARVKAGSSVAIVGPSGSGKTTLVNTLCLLMKPKSGRLLVDGADSSDFEPLSWRRHIGYVSQECAIFDDSIGFNVALDTWDPTNELVREQVWRALAESSLAADIRSLGVGLDDGVGERGQLFSGGQRQRLFIARELFRMPKLLILDEATSALDPRSEHEIQKVLEHLRGRVTQVIIAHRLSSVRSADLVLVLEEGKVVESGKFDELSRKPGSRLGVMATLQGVS